MTTYSKYLKPIASQQTSMTDELIAWSELNSGSTNYDGIQSFQQMIINKAITLFGKDNIEIKTVKLNDFKAIDDAGIQTNMPMVDGLEIRKRVNNNQATKRKILLLGHLDTVFSVQHSFQKTQFIEQPIESPILQYGSQYGHQGHNQSSITLPLTDSITQPVLNGPGVADLKGGLMIMFHALEAFEASPFSEEIEWTIACNPDEEIGSLSSNPWLENLAKEHDIGLIYEPALATGNFAGARKGSGNFTAIIHGKTAHAGRDFFDGRNAIVAMSDLITQLSALTGQKQGLTVNPAYTQGGGALNAVPDFCLIKYNIRFEVAEDEPWISQAVDNIIHNIEEKHQCSIERHGIFGRIPKEMNEAHLNLYHSFVECGKELGMDINWQSTGGCCDGNNLAAAGLVNIDTLGAVGGNLHNNNEFIFIESLTHRAELTALFLMKLANDELPLLDAC